MAASHLTDKQAKKILLRWPGRTQSLWTVSSRGGYWIRGLPKIRSASESHPRLSSPGSRAFQTQPDGMWIYFNDTEYADVVAVEVCGSSQNLNDKRSRYIVVPSGLVLSCPLGWLLAEMPTKAGGWAQRWKACGSIAAEPSSSLQVPVRQLRVLYAIPSQWYDKWSSNCVPCGHEYFCKHSSLDGYGSQRMQEFLKQMSFAAHFLTKLREEG